jgi:type I restriction enzyme, S subunit
MPSKWQDCKLGDVVTLKRGYDLPQQDRRPGPFPIISSSGVTGHHAEAKVKGPGVVTGRYGTLGQVFYVEGAFWPLNTSLYVQDFKGNDPRFVSFFMRSLDLGTRNAAGAVPGVNRNHLHALTVRWPPLRLQRSISGILSAYEDLIENNSRRMRILEEMIRALYREWFVEFRFPGQENARRVHSTLGSVPEGWEVRSVAEAFDILGGGTPSREEPAFWEAGNIQWFSPRDLTAAGTMFMDDSGDHINAAGLQRSSARLFPPFSVMLTSRATIGAIAINTQPATTNQGFITCLPNARVPLYFLHQWLRENTPRFERLATGATFKEISRGVFKTMEVLIPPEALALRYQSLVEPMASQLLSLQRQNCNLRRTRDLLLPRLLSGEITLRESVT